MNLRDILTDPVFDRLLPVQRATLEEFVAIIVRECIQVVEESEGYSQYFPHVVDNIKERFKDE